MWGCGLKLLTSIPKGRAEEVTPYVGVWIEIPSVTVAGGGDTVTPYVGVWIEIKGDTVTFTGGPSPPMWGCGLK